MLRSQRLGAFGSAKVTRTDETDPQINFNPMLQIWTLASFKHNASLPPKPRVSGPQTQCELVVFFGGEDGGGLKVRDCGGLKSQQCLEVADIREDSRPLIHFST